MSRKQTILLVEDEIIVGEFPAGILEKAGYNAVHVHTGKEAIETVKKNAPDLILMDIGLKEKDGIETAREILNEHTIPIIFTTAFSEDETFERAQKISSYGYLVKPINEQQLIVTVKMALTQHSHTIKQDIAEYERKEDFQRQQEKLKVLVDNLPEGVLYRLIHDPDGRTYFDYVSDGFEHMFELQREQVYQDATPMYSMLHPEDRAKALATETRSAEKMKLFRYECRFVLPGNRIRWLRWHSMPERLPNGGLVWSGAILNITDRKRAEKALKESEDRHRLFFENAPIGILHYNNKGIITDVNETMIATFGSSRDKLIGLDINDIPDKKFSKEVYKTLDGEQGYYEGLYTSYTGKKEAYIKADWIPIIDDGKVVSGVGIVEDITKRKQADKKLKASLKEKEWLLKEVHHRVKNNLQVIVSLFNMQSQKIEDEKFLEIFIDLQNRVRSMAIIHENLYQTTSFEKIDLPHYIKTLAVNLMQTYRKRSVDLCLDIADVHLGLNVAIPCGLIINELMTNSLKHAFPNIQKGTISINCFYRDEKTVILVLKDNGIGFAEGFLEKGSLGLKLVKMLTIQLEGHVEFITDNGARVTIEFPIKEQIQQKVL